MLTRKIVARNLMVSILSPLNAWFFRKTIELETKISYKVELNFKAPTQVLYIKKNQIQIEKINSNLWERDVFEPIQNLKIIKLKAFINISNLNYTGEARLSIFIRNNLVSEKIFSIDCHQDYSDWLILTYDFS